MKMAILTTLAAFLCIITQAQFLTQSNDGKSTIPLPLKGIGLSLDVGKSEVAIGANNYKNVLEGKSRILFGGNLSAKNAEGLASLFSNGDIVPQGDFLGFFGYSFSNWNRMIGNIDGSIYDSTILRNNKSLDSLFQEYVVVLKQEIILLSYFITDTIERLNTTSQLLDLVSKAEDPTQLKAVVTDFKPVEASKRFGVELERRWNQHLKEYKLKSNEVLNWKRSEDKVIFDEYIKRLIPVRFTAFLQGGISARSFTRYISLSMPILPKSFQDTLFRGGNIGIGFNLQIKNFWLGASYSYLATDNFPVLKSKDYILRSVDTSGNQLLISEKKITGYAGTYGKVETNQLNIDLIGDFRMNDTSRLITNLYLRSSIHSRDTSLLKNFVNIGLGVYFVGKKSSFLGGLYVELPDLNNNLEKAKLPDDQNIRSPIKKLSFGIVTKFSVASILSWSNRPAKPD